MAPSVCAVVPIKPFRSAKTRLSSALDEDRRAALSQVSALRVLRAVGACGAVQRRIAVVEDEETADLARRNYFEVMLRPGLWGQSAAVDAGFEAGREQQPDTLLTVSADVPLARPEDILEMLAGDGPVLTMASDLQGTGTNALRLSPAIDFRLHFGPDSLRTHQREANEMKLPVRIVDNPRLRLDLDTADDLLALERSGPEGRQVLIEAGQVQIDAAKVAREELAREPEA